MNDDLFKVAITRRHERLAKRFASAIEAQRATTVQQGAVHESAVLRQQQTPEPGDPRSPE